jgi:exopolysaccharide biosynthesis polyprenyl glycosylphosphotransferase
MRNAAMSEGVIPDLSSSLVQELPLERALLCRRRLHGEGARIVAELGRAVLVWFSLFVLYAEAHPISLRELVALTFSALVWVVGLRATAASSHPAASRLLTTGSGTALGLGVVAALNSSAVGLRVSFGSLATFALAVLCSATAWDWFVARTSAGRRRVLLVGAQGVEALVAEELGRSRKPAFDLVGAIPGSGELRQVVQAQRPDVVVIADEAAYEAALEGLLDARTNVRITSLASFFEHAFGRVPIDLITPAWFVCLLHPRQHTYSRLTKRAFDVGVSAVALVIAAPLVAASAVLTKARGGGPAFYRQTRVGEGGRLFTVYKIRTMSCDAESEGARFCVEGDPRATRLGSFLRRTHIDELPQLWNVLNGDMSVVGPRPERPEFIETLEQAVPFWSRRLLVKPGITGWAQVRCGYAFDCEGMKRKLSYDLWYLRHRSLLVDVGVCVATFSAVLRRTAGP